MLAFVVPSPCSCTAVCGVQRVHPSATPPDPLNGLQGLFFALCVRFPALPRSALRRSPGLFSLPAPGARLGSARLSGALLPRSCPVSVPGALRLRGSLVCVGSGGFHAGWIWVCSQLAPKLVTVVMLQERPAGKNQTWYREVQRCTNRLRVG